MKLKKGTQLYLGGRHYVGPSVIPDHLVPDGLKESKIWDRPKPTVKKPKDKNDD